jgi:hypothetical protein
MKFYDATDPRNYPHGQPACFYGDGRWAVTATDVIAIAPPERRFITVTGNGRTCSILDGRPDNPLTAAQVRGFVRDRRGAQEDAIIYCPRSWVAEYQRILFDDGHGQLGAYGRLWWWIATLDGIDWTPENLAADIAANWDATIQPGRIWAVQNNQLPAIGPGALVDQSQLFLPWHP